MSFDNLINLLTLLVSVGGLFIAYKALSTWKEELKAKKLYELNTKAYNLLSGIRNCISESLELLLIAFNIRAKLFLLKLE